MTEEEISKKVVEHIAYVLNRDEKDFTPESNLYTDFSAYKMDTLEIAIRVEDAFDKFDVYISACELEHLSTVQDWVKLISEKVGANKAN